MDIGSRYDETRSLLACELRNESYKVWMSERTSLGHACYFCLGRIEAGEDMIQILRNSYDSFGVTQERFFADSNCINKIMKKGSSNLFEF